MKFWNSINKIFLTAFFKWNFINERSHIKMSQYSPKPFRSFGGNINVKVNLSNYAIRTYLKMWHMLILQVLH